MISQREREYQAELQRRLRYVSQAEQLAGEMMVQGTGKTFTLHRDTPNGPIEILHIDPDRFNRGVQIIRRAIEADQATSNSRQRTPVARVLEDVKTVGVFLRKTLK